MCSTKFPYEIKPAVGVEKYAKFYKGKTYLGKTDGQVVVGPKEYLLPKGYARIAETIYNMAVRPDDTFVVSYPRSGTTWTQELVWLIENNMDFEKSKSIPLLERYQFLEQSMFTLESARKDIEVETDHKKKQRFMVNATPGTEVFEKMPSPRFIMSHLPPSLLPAKVWDTVKMVYVARDPRDVVVSNYHFTKSMVSLQYQGDFKAYFDQFTDDCAVWTPCLEHVKEGWDFRNHPNVLFLFYEELSKDIDGSMRRVSQFFGKQYTDEQFAALENHLHIDNFKKNPSVLRDSDECGEEFVRKGKVGGWTEYLDGDMRARMDRWMQEGLRGSTLRFPSQ